MCWEVVKELGRYQVADWTDKFVLIVIVEISGFEEWENCRVGLCIRFLM